MTEFSDNPWISWFIDNHKDQFLSIGLPLHLYQIAASKIINNIFDISDYVIFSEQDDEHEDEDDTNNESNNNIDEINLETYLENKKSKYSVLSTQNIEANSNVFIVDHMWTTTFPQSRSQLSNIEGLRQRICN